MKVKIVPLGGLGEIGLNMMVFEYGDTMMIVDAGLMFPEDYMLGIDYVIPDLEYIRRRKSDVLGVVLTHAHEDHIGALPFLLREIDAPVFGTPFTLGVVRHKLEEYELPGSVSFHDIHPGDMFRLGDFEIEAIRVSHSVVDCIGLSVRTPLGQFVHTGDFRINLSDLDGMMTDINRFAKCGEQGVLALLSDSTNVEKSGYTASDSEIADNLDRIFRRGKGRIIVALFASNVGRIQQIIKIAIKRGRKVVFDGRSIEASVRIAKELGYVHIPDEIEIEIDQIGHFPDEEILMITTGSQGEPMSALARMASGMHKQIAIREGDTVILSSKFIPGNEKAIAKIINNIFRRGANVVYEKISDVHVSGHAFQEELKLMINLTNPEYFIPIHGEYRHLLLHGRLARKTGIDESKILLAENGSVIEFDENGGRVLAGVGTGRVMVDGKGIGDVGKSILKERRALSEDGFVTVTMAIDEDTGIIMYGPEIVSKGFVFQTESGYLLEDAVCVVLEIVEEIKPDTQDRIGKIRSKIQSDLRKYFNFTIKRRPLILPFILEV